MPKPTRDEVAVLASGGLDSAILCVDLLEKFQQVHPLYIRCGLRWENEELASLRRFLVAVGRDSIAGLVVLDEPVRDVYGEHWSTGGAGTPVPGAETPDEAVYLPGRNLLLTVKAALWCRLRGIGTLALGSLGSNPFPDSTANFFEELEAVIGRALDGSPRLIRPFDQLHKADVIRKGHSLPLHLTLSCINPIDGRHCGACNKCEERRNGFREAGIVDRTNYAHSPGAVTSRDE
jgi:7-cyano-7-deazaguanine synthase